MAEDERSQRIAKAVSKLEADGAGGMLNPVRLSSGEELLVGLNFALGLERNARTASEQREAFRVWLATITTWMQRECAHPEFLSLPFKFNGYLEDLERGRQPPQLTAVARDGKGNPGVGIVAVTRPATACAMVDFLTATVQPTPQVAALEARFARDIGWSPSRFRAWRKRFNRGEAGADAQRIYEVALQLAKSGQTGACPSPEEVAATLIRNAMIFG
jgi:hypothetical protein